MPEETRQPERPSAAVPPDSLPPQLPRDKADTGPEAVLREARQRFVAGFPKRCDSIELLLKAIAARGAQGPAGPLREVAHQVAGMAGTVGFEAVSEIASELEGVAQHADSFDLDAARRLVEALHASFASELAAPPAWAASSRAAASPLRVLVVEDADDQRQLVTDYLRAAGREVLALATGEGVVDIVRAERPGLVLLDANLPGLDGYSICRLLKSDAELAPIPVIFMTVRSSLDDRLAGLTLGADDYLVKPVDLPELLLRIEVVVRRARAAKAAQERAVSVQGQLLSYDEFVRSAREQLRMAPATFALVRTAENDADEVIPALRAIVRQRDIVSRYDPTHAVLLLPGAPPALVRHRIADLSEGMQARGIKGVFAGISFSTAPSEKLVEALLAEADDALAEARYLGESAAVKSDRPRSGPPASGTTMIVVAETDGEVARIVETQFRATGYQTVAVADGEAALMAVQTHRPDVLVLSLKVPKVSGFEVLARLQQLSEGRPRVVVLSSRGRDEDVTQAFELGADDYVMKPFSPRELMARVARLLR